MDVVSKQAVRKRIAFRGREPPMVKPETSQEYAASWELVFGLHRYFSQGCDWRAKKRATRFFFAKGQINFH